MATIHYSTQPTWANAGPATVPLLFNWSKCCCNGAHCAADNSVCRPAKPSTVGTYSSLLFGSDKDTRVLQRLVSFPVLLYPFQIHIHIEQHSLPYFYLKGTNAKQDSLCVHVMGQIQIKIPFTLQTWHMTMHILSSLNSP